VQSRHARPSSNRGSDGGPFIVSPVLGRVAVLQKQRLYQDHGQREQNRGCERQAEKAEARRNQAGESTAGIPAALGGKLKPQCAGRKLGCIVDRRHPCGQIEPAEQGGADGHCNGGGGAVTDRGPQHETDGENAGIEPDRVARVPHVDDPPQRHAAQGAGERGKRESAAEGLEKKDMGFQSIVLSQHVENMATPSRAPYRREMRADHATRSAGTWSIKISIAPQLALI
jgi:hypothetical protein